jgi:hypothetical protein
VISLVAAAPLLLLLQNSYKGWVDDDATLLQLLQNSYKG